MKNILSGYSVAGDGEALIDRGDASGVCVGAAGSGPVMHDTIAGDNAMEAAGKQTLSGKIHPGSDVNRGRPGSVRGVVGGIGKHDCAHVIPAGERQPGGATIDLHSDIGAGTLVGIEDEAQGAWCESSSIGLGDVLISRGSGDDTLAEGRPRERADQQEPLHGRWLLLWLAG